MTQSELFVDIDRPPPRDLKGVTAARSGQPPDAQRATLNIVERAIVLAEPPRNISRG